MPSNKIHKGLKFLITLRGVPIGGARLILSENKKTAYVASVCILEEFRGIKAGYFLMKHMHAEATAMGVSKIYLASVGTAVNFYKALGYLPVDVKHAVPAEFLKPMHAIWKEYKSGKYPYRIEHYLYLLV